MTRSSTAIGLVLAASLAFGCGDTRRRTGSTVPNQTGSTDTGSGGDGLDAGGCPPPPVTGIACRETQIGMTCPGIVNCMCSTSSFPVTQPTTCQCQPGVALAWSCVDQCACGGPEDAGVRPSDATSGGQTLEELCIAWCVHLESANCPLPLDGCQDGCAGQTLENPECEAEARAQLDCHLSAPVVCVEELGGFPMPSGCEAENEAYSDCTG